MKYIIGVLIALILIGCSSTKEIEKTSYTEVLRDTTIQVPEIKINTPVEPVYLDTSAYDRFVDSFTDSSYLNIPTEHGEIKIKRTYGDKGEKMLEAEGTIDPPPVKAGVKDTKLVKEKEKVIQVAWYEKILGWLIGGVVLLVIVLVLLNKIKSKFF
jgi:hypothetical protein